MSTIPPFLLNCTEPAVIIERAKHYVSEDCGVCEQKGAEIFWPNPNSRWAHMQCLNVISAAESTLTQTIEKLFKDQWDRNEAHSKAVNEIKKKCSPDSLLTYTEKNGVEAITYLFNTVGVKSAEKFAEKLQIEDAKNTGRCIGFAFAVSAIDDWAAKL